MDFEQLGGALRAMREQAGLSRAELARRAELSRLTVRLLERGASDPRWSTLVMFARGCGVELQILPGEHLLP